MLSEKHNPFRSFWMAGFECTDKLNCFGNRVDFLKVTGHLEKIGEDYQNLSFFNIKTVREGIRWSQVEKSPYQYDWKDVHTMIASARENDIQQVWDICHFGFPDDLTPLHPMFARRFAAVCRAFVKFYRAVEPDAPLVVTPINEVSFLSWLGGDVCGTSPYCKGQGWEVKYALMRAYIEGIEAMVQEDSSVRIMTTEPLVNMVAPFDATEEQLRESVTAHEAQFQVLDILSGKMCPELRGRPEYLDIIGCNFYFNNQWVSKTFEFLAWDNSDNDPRWLTVGALLKQVYQRYNVPVVLSETSHPGEHRPEWMEYVARECNNIISEGVPLWGICWYPIIDRPDWDHMQPWHKAGIWDVEPQENGDLVRVIDPAAANALLRAQAYMDHSGKLFSEGSLKETP
jgi:hypothetical protein